MFSIKNEKLKNIVLFNPDYNLDDPALQNNIYLKIENGDLSFKILSSRYLLIGTEKVDCDVNSEITVPLKNLQDIIKNFSADTIINFEVKNKEVKIEAETIKFKLKCFEKENKNIDFEFSDMIKFKTNSFLEGIKKVKVAIGDDEVRYYLNGVCFEIFKDKEEKLHNIFTATTGHILGHFGKTNQDYELLHRIIIPRKVIPDIIKILEKAGDDFELAVNKNKLLIKTNNLEILLKLIDGDFPDYQKVIPQNNNKIASINSGVLKQLLEKILIITNDRTKLCNISIKEGIINLEILGSDGNIANANSIISCDTEIQVKLDGNYLKEVLGQFDDEMIDIKFVDATSPILIQHTKKDLIFIIMPIKN